MKLLMHVNDETLHGENGGTTPETSHQFCIMRKVISKKVTAGGRFDFFLDSGFILASVIHCHKRDEEML